MSLNSLTSLHVAVAQHASLIGDIPGNLALVESLCQQAASSGGDLILFPEANVTGYSYQDVAGVVARTAEPLNGRIGQRLLEIAAQYQLVVCAGMFERDGNEVYNVLAIAFPDGRLERQRKGKLSDAELGIIVPWRTREVFEWKGVRFGALVCADSALEGYRKQLRKLDIQLLLHPSAGRLQEVTPEMEVDDDRSNAHILAQALRKARKMNLTYAVANPVGFSGEDFYPGNSWVIGPDGRGAYLAAASKPEEMVPKVAIFEMRSDVKVLQPA